MTIDAAADAHDEREQASAVLGLTKSMLKRFWEKSRSAGGRTLPILESAFISCVRPGRESLFFEFQGELRAKLRPAKGFDVRIELMEDGGTRLLIENGSEQDEGLFVFLALDLLEIAAKFEKEAAGVRFRLIIGRLKAWRLFMRNRSRLLSPSQELSLAGELFFLKNCLEKGVEVGSLQSFWTGPLHGARDFAFGGETYVEVKTTTTPMPLRVRIDSLEQLDAGTANVLMLCAVVMQTAEPLPEVKKPQGMRTLAQLAEDAEAVLPNDSLREELRTLLLAAGLSNEQREASVRLFRPESIRFFRAEILPSLTPGKMPGIVKASYEIELFNVAGAPPAGSEDAQMNAGKAWQILTNCGGADAFSDEDDVQADAHETLE